MKWTIETFQYYLWDQWLEVITEHARLEWLQCMKNAKNAVIFGATTICFHCLLS